MRRRSRATPIWLTALSHLAFCKFWSGSVEEMIPLREQLIRLSPRDPGCGQWYFRIGLAHLLQSHVADAIQWLEKARGAHPTRRNGRAALAAAYGLNGDAERASAELAAARRLVSDDRFSSVARVKSAGWFPAFPGDFGAPKTRALFEATYFAGLRKAGMPEE